MNGRKFTASTLTKNFVNNVVKYMNEHEVEDLPLFIIGAMPPA